MTQSQNRHYLQLTEIASRLEREFIPSDEAWNESPFGWIKSRPSRTVGAIFESIVDAWIADNGMRVRRTGDSNADRMVERIRVEIKGSTLWKNGSYKFQQIRDQDYDLIICLGISPFEAHVWVIPKETIPNLWEAGVIKGQHTGQAARDTGWITVSPKDPPPLLVPPFGDLAAAIEMIRSIAQPK